MLNVTIQNDGKIKLQSELARNPYCLQAMKMK